jgi:phage tail-like protein
MTAGGPPPGKPSPEPQSSFNTASYSVASQAPTTFDSSYSVASQAPTTVDSSYSVASQAPTSFNTGYNVASQAPTSFNTGYSVAGNAPTSFNTGYSVAGNAPTSFNTGYSVAGNAPTSFNTAYSVAGNAPTSFNTAYSVAGNAPTSFNTAYSVAGPAPTNFDTAYNLNTTHTVFATQQYDYGPQAHATNLRDFAQVGYGGPTLLDRPPEYVPTARYVGPGLPPPRGPQSEVDDPPLTTNYYVIIDSVSCGRWLECSGLGMKYKTANYVETGSTTSNQLLAQKDLQTLTLTRPFNGTESMELLHWFEVYAHVTMPLTATVIATDMIGNPLYYWELSGVVPVEWVGPKFKAGEAQYCTEVLKLTYTDFLAYGTMDAAGIASGGVEGALSVVGDVLGATLGAPRLWNMGSGAMGMAEAAVGALAGTNGITFAIIPGTFTISSGVKKNKTGNAIKADANANQSWSIDDRKLSFEFVLDCLTIGAASLGNPLSTLMSPAFGIEPQLMFLASLTGQSLWSGTSAMSAAGLLSSALTALGGLGPQESPSCQFVWGDFSFQGLVTSLNIKINITSARGTPQRATVSITITETGNPSKYPFQNPTSSANGASITHTVVAGDSLASIAYSVYGKADQWRGIAEMNGIDDPLRLRPGTTLLLPTARDARAAK